MSNRKYPKVVGYWVYSIQIKSNGKYYIGVSQMQCYQRWCKSSYKDCSLAPYIDEWDSMTKTVLVDGLTKEEALTYEGKIIDALSMNNLCINEQRSGLIYVNDKNAYARELRKNNTELREYYKQYNKQWIEDNKEQYREYQKEYQKEYYQKNKEKIREKHRQYRENNKEKIREHDKQRARQRRLKKKLEKQQQTVVD